MTEPIPLRLRSNVDTAVSGCVPGEEAGACEMNFLCTVRFPMCQKNKLEEVYLDRVACVDPSPCSVPPIVEKKKIKRLPSSVWFLTLEAWCTGGGFPSHTTRDHVIPLCVCRGWRLPLHQGAEPRSASRPSASRPLAAPPPTKHPPNIPVPKITAHRKLHGGGASAVKDIPGPCRDGEV